MAIAFIASATQQIPAFAFTAHAGATDTCLIVAAFAGGGAGATMTAVTFDGVGMTKLNAIVSASVDPNTELSLWYLANPASGSKTLDSTRSNGTFSRISVMSFSGVDQTTPVNTANEATQEIAVAAASSLAVTTANDNSWLVGGLLSPNNPPTGDSNTTIPGAGNYYPWYSPTAQTPAGSHALGYTDTMTSVMFVAEMIVTGGGGGGGSAHLPYLNLLGVGA